MGVSFTLPRIAVRFIMLALLLVIGQGSSVSEAQQQCTLTVSGSFRYLERDLQSAADAENFYVELRNASSDRLDGAWTYTSSLGAFQIVDAPTAPWHRTNRL